MIYQFQCFELKKRDSTCAEHIFLHLTTKETGAHNNIFLALLFFLEPYYLVVVVWFKDSR